MKVIDYREEFGLLNLPAGFKKELEGKSIEDQLNCYGISDYYLNPMSFHMMGKGFEFYGIRPVPTDKIDGVIVKDGLVVGVTRNENPCLPYRLWSREYYSDNNGAGYKESYSYTYLVCVPANVNRDVVKKPPFRAVEEFKVKVLECDHKVSYDEEFLNQIKGKSIPEQMDYFIFKDSDISLDTSDEDFNLKWILDKYGILLSYTKAVTEVLVNDGVIVGANIKAVNKDFEFEKDYTAYVFEPIHEESYLGRDSEDVMHFMNVSYDLQPVIY